MNYFFPFFLSQLNFICQGYVTSYQITWIAQTEHFHVSSFALLPENPCWDNLPKYYIKNMIFLTWYLIQCELSLEPDS